MRFRQVQLHFVIGSLSTLYQRLWYLCAVRKMPTKTVTKRFRAIYTVDNFDAVGNPLKNLSVLTPLYVWDDVKSGSSVPSFRQKLRDGTDATSVYTVSAQKRSVVPGYCELQYKAFFFGQPKAVTVRVDGEFAPLVSPSGSSSAILSRLVNDSKLKFLLKCRQKQTFFEGMTFVGELKEALHSIRHPAQALKREITSYLTHLDKNKRRIRKLPRKGRRRFLRDSWLEAQFSWLPIISDARSAAEALSENMNKFRRQIEPVHYSAESEDGFGSLSENPFYSISGSGSTYHYLVARSRYKLQVALAGGVIVSVGRGNSGFDSTLWGFNPSNFVPTLWELLPWSWAIDYFSNVGDVLSAWSFGTSSLAWSSMTTKSSSRCDVWLTPNHSAMRNDQGSNYISSSGNGSRSTTEVFELSRGVGIGSLPSFSFSLSELDPRKLVNLTSALSTHRSISRFINAD